MSFLHWPIEGGFECSRRFQQRRKELAVCLIRKFQRVFPEIAYELIWESALVNAQAWRFGTRRYVRAYGGIVRCKMITKSGLALILAHETGHHLAGLPRDPDMPWMTWQGQADYWAASTAMPRVFGSKARALTLCGALQILRLHSELAAQLEDDEPDLSPQCRYAILRAGALGLELPTCAEMAFMQLFIQ